MNASPVTTYPYSIPTLVLAGNCGYEIQGDDVIINIAEIANNRDADNISGTLAIELWALPQPYYGGDFSGIALAGTAIGELYGQHFLADSAYKIPFQAPSEGTWYVVLMLREWTENSYVTCDFINFDVPYIVDNKPIVVRHDDSNIINVSFAENNKPAAKKAVKNTATAGKKAVKTVTKTSKVAQVSLNQASLAEIEAIKGVSKKLAENIVLARPFTTLEEVLKVKGVGEKLLEKIRQFISL
jgi:competence ComEA-like helix-hairpin-helix protein